MNNDYILTLDNILAAIRMYQEPDATPLSWCAEYAATFTDDQLTAAIDKTSALDLIYDYTDITERIGRTDSDVWQFVTGSTADPLDYVVIALALVGYTGEGVQPDNTVLNLALSLLTATALIIWRRREETLAIFENLTESEKRRASARLGGIRRHELADQPLKLQCSAWADDIIRRYREANQPDPTKSALAKKVDAAYRDFLQRHSPDTREYMTLHPAGRRELEYRTILRWVQDKVRGQRRNKNSPV